MKKYILLIATLLFSLSAVAQPDPLVASYFQWEQENMAKAKTGEIKWSVFFTDAFDRASSLPNHPIKTFKLQLYSESIPLARRYERREISFEQFQDEGRIIFAKAQAVAESKLQEMQAQEKVNQESENQRRAQQQAQEKAAQQARQEQARQQMMQGLILLDAARPKFPSPMMSPSVNCTSRAVGNTVQTNCF